MPKHPSVVGHGSWAMVAVMLLEDKQHQVLAGQPGSQAAGQPLYPQKQHQALATPEAQQPQEEGWVPALCSPFAPRPFRALCSIQPWRQAPGEFGHQQEGGYVLCVLHGWRQGTPHQLMVGAGVSEHCMMVAQGGAHEVIHCRAAFLQLLLFGRWAAECAYGPGAPTPEECTAGHLRMGDHKCIS
eukprot:1021309-Pelagomonas_calceolata.AAC.1